MGREIRLPENKKRGLQGWVLSLLLMAAVVAYSLLYFNNTYPISEGWGVNYAELMFRGKFPYRDFYYYLPPLNLWIDELFWKLSFGSLLAFRIWYLAQRLVLWVLIFRLLRRFFDQYYAFLACVLAAIISTGDVYDLFGDYNQTTDLVAVLLSYCAADFAMAETKRKKLAYMGLAGVTLGAAFLNKQTIFVACFIVFFLALTALCILKKDKGYWGYCLAVAGGLLLPVAGTAIYLAANGALVPFIEQVYVNVDGKGTLFHILVYSIISRLWKPAVWSAIFLLFGLVTLEDARNDVDRKKAALAAGLLLCGLVLCVYSQFAPQITDFARIVSHHRSAMASALLCFVLFAASLYGARRDRERLSRETIVRLETLAVLAGTMAMIGINLYTSVFAKELYSESAIFHMGDGALSSFVLLASIALIAAWFYKWRRADVEDKPRYEAMLFVICGGFCLEYAGVMAAGDQGFACRALKILLPFMVCALLSVRMRHPIVSRALKGGAIAVCIVLATACVAEKIACSYEWWGSHMAPREEKVYSVDIPAMKGIKVSADQKELYETVTAIIEENTDEDAVIWGYPHIKLFNVLTDRYNMDTFVPVLFYDVVSDVYVEQERDLLAENLPDVVIWEQIDGVLEAHENVYRHGEPLKQREIEALFAQVLPEKYELKAQVGNVSVYLLKDHA